MSDLERKLYLDPDTFTATLLALLAYRYGPGGKEADADDDHWVNWLPETVFMEVQDDLGITLPEEVRGKITVGMNLLRSEDFFRRPSFFVQSCAVMGGGEFDPSEFVFATAQDCCWGIIEALSIRPPDGKLEDAFHAECLGYVGKVLVDEGYNRPPKVLAGILSKYMPKTDIAAEGFFDDATILQTAIDVQKEQVALLDKALDDLTEELAAELQLVSSSMARRVTPV